MLVVSSAVTLCVLVYSIGQGMADGDEETPLSIFHPTYLVLTAGVSNAFLAGDLFNLYVGFEILLVASYVLLTLGGTEARIRAGTTYVGGQPAVVADLPDRDRAASTPPPAPEHGPARRAAGRAARRRCDLMLQAMLLLAFGIKAAVFPLSAWLPDSYPTAPGAGHRGLRRPAHQGRRLRDHPDRDAAVPRRTGSPTCCWSSPC